MKRIFFGILICFLICIPIVSADAFSAWTAYGDAWKATNDTYTIVMWNATGSHSWVATGNASSVAYLVVAGGGGGGPSVGGGGGGGGARAGTGLGVSGSINIVVGSGGSGSTGVPTNGINSSFAAISASGGGRGGYGTGGSGGSGGGGEGAGTHSGGSGNFGGYTPVEGYAGGSVSNSAYGGGGGGGAGAVGSTATNASGGPGGGGLYSPITGLVYGGGGGGGARDGVGGAAGGSGGGGKGGGTTGVSSGTNGLGGGGGGGTNTGLGSGSGGSGIVIISYLTTPAESISSAFSGTPLTGHAPLDVTFTDESTGVPNYWNWSFGDGEILIGKPDILKHTYASKGLYSVNLSVGNNTGGNSSLVKTDYINVLNASELYPSFDINATSGHMPFPVVVNDTSTNFNATIDSWEWDFVEGSTHTLDNNQNATFTYNSTEVPKYATLTITNSSFGIWNSTSVNITAVSASSFTQQDIWMDPQYTLTLHVTDSATGLVIPDVSLTDSSTTYLTTNGTFILTYPYSTVVLTLASTGYAGKQVSYVMDSDREETVQLTAQSTSKTTTWYSPHQVRLAVISNTGTLLPGTTVNATANSTTMPDDYLTSLYGIDPTIANDMLNGTLIMSGVTGSDGAIVYTMHGSISYDVSLINPATGTLFKIFLMPIENNYDIRLGATTANATYSQINATMLTVSEPDVSHFKLGVNYLDTSGLSNNMTFTVSCVDNGTVLYKQEYTAFGTSAILSNYTLANVWGEGYVWKYVAYRADGSVLSQGATVTGKGPNGVMVDLGLPSLNWYRWVSVCILFMMGAMASQRTKQFWALLIPIFAALFLWFGWFTGTSSTAGIITLCVVLGAIVYMKSSLREKFGVGGPGTMLLNIVIYLLILQACVGFINGLNVWTDAGFGNQATAVVNQWSNIEISDISDLQSTGGWGLTALATAEFFADMLLSAAIVFINILFSIVTIYPTVQLLFPWMLTSPQTIAFLALLQLGIWILYAKFMFDYFAKPSYGTDDF